MCKLIIEKEILLSDIIVAPVNKARRWQSQLQFIVDNEAINYDVKITFATQSGNRVVNTHIVAVIESYVKINEGIIIPLSSIVNVYFKENVVIITDDNRHIWAIILIIMIALICFALILFSK